MEIKKPLSVARAEFISMLTNLVNDSALPYFVIEPILKDMYNDVRVLSQRQYEADSKMYQEQLEKLENEQG